MDRWGCIALASALATSFYSGLLMIQMKSKVMHAVVFADLGYEGNNCLWSYIVMFKVCAINLFFSCLMNIAFGNLGKAFVTLFGYTYIAGVCVSYFT